MKSLAYRNRKDEILFSPDHKGAMGDEGQRFFESQSLCGMSERGGESPRRSSNPQELKCTISDLACDQAPI